MKENIFVVKAICVLTGLIILPACQPIQSEPLVSVPFVERVELVAADTGGGFNNGENAWGGHQTRIVRNRYGLFTAYTVSGTGTFSHESDFDREWRLAKRTGDNQWTVIAKGQSGREPVNLLTSPDGELYIIGWPNKAAYVWKLDDEGVVLEEYHVPGQWYLSDWPYGSAGTNENGDTVVLQSVDKNSPQSDDFRWSYYSAAEKKWYSHYLELSAEKRHCYTFLFPCGDGAVRWVSNRGVKWSEVGLCYPKGRFAYVFDSVGYWNIQDAKKKSAPEYLKIKQALQADCEWLYCSALGDAYVDTRGRMHILYKYQCDETQDQRTYRHAVVAEGRVVKDVEHAREIGELQRIIQDTKGRFYVISSRAKAIYPALCEDGTILGEPVPLDLGSYEAEYSGISLAVPRCGVRLADYVDCVFPSGGYKQWVYCRIRLRN